MFVVESGDGACSWQIQPDEGRDDEGGFRPTALMAKVSRFLELRGDETPSRNQIEDGVQGKRDYIRLAVNRLIEEGYATGFSGPRGAKLVRLERLFTEDDEADEWAERIRGEDGAA